MNQYTPDKWLVVKIEGKEVPLVYKVFACWYGGYLNGDSWKINSGIKKVTNKRGYYEFEGYSGSVYRCNKKCYGINSYGMSVLNKFIDKAKEVDTIIEVLDEKTKWLDLNYEYETAKVQSLG